MISAGFLLVIFYAVISLSVQLAGRRNCCFSNNEFNKLKYNLFNKF